MKDALGLMKLISQSEKDISDNRTVDHKSVMDDIYGRISD